MVECEDVFYEDLDALVAYATEHTNSFIFDSTLELEKVEIVDDLEITYRTIDDIDDNDNEVWVTKTEKFSYSYKELVTVVRS
jgi:hypothetical protein